jgi:hypothetical protein
MACWVFCQAGHEPTRGATRPAEPRGTGTRRSASRPGRSAIESAPPARIPAPPAQDRGYETVLSLVRSASASTRFDPLSRSRAVLDSRNGALRNPASDQAFPPRHGALMEQSGRNRWKAVANAEAPRTANSSQDRCYRLRPVAGETPQKGEGRRFESSEGSGKVRNSKLTLGWSIPWRQRWPQAQAEVGPRMSVPGSPQVDCWPLSPSGRGSLPDRGWIVLIRKSITAVADSFKPGLGLAGVFCQCRLDR